MKVTPIDEVQTGGSRSHRQIKAFEPVGGAVALRCTFVVPLVAVVIQSLPLSNRVPYFGDNESVEGHTADYDDKIGERKGAAGREKSVGTVVVFVLEWQEATLSRVQVWG